MVLMKMKVTSKVYPSKKVTYELVIVPACEFY